ncbi:MAG: nuclear transport factor 2 family protein [Solobacterium sp.]|nr:nuclear transport factor 2 family protein [Solobacterium sp.]
MKKIILTALILVMTAACTGTGSAGGNEDMGYEFSQLTNVRITGINVSSLSEEELAVLYAQARYCQAMTDADIEVMRELVAEDKIYTHMSGRQQTREEYFADVADGSLNYFTIGIEDPVIRVNGNKAQITYTSILNANAYGARGTYRMKGTHCYEKRNGSWILVNR